MSGRSRSAGSGDEPVLSVSELTDHIKAVLEGTFPALWVAGEISDLSRPRSGHIYFALKDDSAQIRGVMWRSSVTKLNFDLEDGQSVLAYGNVEVYAPRGTYQLVVSKVQPQGIGALQLAFEQLKAKLYAEGLFDLDRKRSLPPIPRRIAIVTSPSGAALQDFLQAAANRKTPCEIIVIPANVQGVGASESIVAGIRAAHKLRPRPDVLIVGRGGGSLEDLWCFNEEPVVRALAASEIPTVSAVGHEIDVTLSDFAADVRALTPTDAATRVLLDHSALVATTRDSFRRLVQSLHERIEAERRQLQAISQRPIIRKPLEFVHRRSRELDELDARLDRAVSNRLRLGRQQLQGYAATLSALSPLGVLSRGYSITSDSQGAPITDASLLKVGDQVTTRLKQGEFESTVQAVRVPPTSLEQR